jgi:hypothetical protein
MLVILSGVLWPQPHLFMIEEDEQRITLAVTTYTKMTPSEWKDLKEYERVPWMEETISKLPDEDAEETVKPVGTEENGSKPKPKEPNPANAAEFFLGEEMGEILKIAGLDKSCNDKMREICGIDRRFIPWKSPRWAKSLQVSEAAIRNTKFWKVDRPKLREADNFMHPKAENNLR